MSVSFRDALPDATEDELKRVEARFPDTPCPYPPFGGWVMVQDAKVVDTIGSGLLVKADVTKDIEKIKQTVARIAAIGPLAGYDELNATDLPGWPWFEVGDFVKLSPHAAQRWDVEDSVFRAVHYKDIICGINTVREVLR